MSDRPTPQQVEAVLKGARTKSAPGDADLLPVYNYLFAPLLDRHEGQGAGSASASASASTSALPSRQIEHFYCSKCPSDLHRDAATYLIFLFAFKRDGMPRRFLDALEEVLKGCTSCARVFGAARRRFAKT